MTTPGLLTVEIDAYVTEGLVAQAEEKHCIATPVPSPIPLVGENLYHVTGRTNHVMALLEYWGYEPWEFTVIE